MIRELVMIAVLSSKLHHLLHLWIVRGEENPITPEPRNF